MQLAELQNKSNKLSLTAMAIGAKISEAINSADDYDATEVLLSLSDLLEAAADAFEDFTDEIETVLKRRAEDIKESTW